ncbi:hypothetical protein EC960428_0988, partial [Escherichia coli 96.0428]
MEVGHF